MMNKRTKLTVCNWALLALTIPTVISSIWIEATEAAAPAWVWIHIIAATLFIVFLCMHIYLHFNKKQRTVGKHHGFVKWMAAIAMLVLISACIATIHWIATDAHSSIGGIHGKIGFCFLIPAIIHIIRHRNFYSL